MPASFDYHILFEGEVVDRATNEEVAITACERRQEIHGRGFKHRTLTILHVPTDTVIGKFEPARGFLPHGRRAA